MRNGEADFVSLQPSGLIGSSEVHDFVRVEKGAAGMPDADEEANREEGIDPEIPMLVEG